MTITADKQGRRIYLRGDTYPVRDQLRAAGAKWDADARCWYTGKQATADEIITKVGAGATTAAQPGAAEATSDRLTDDSEVSGRARYKGREYLLVWEGDTRRGPAAKLAFLDGSSVFWASHGEYEVTKRYQARRIRGRSCPMTFGRLTRLREEFAEQRQAEHEADQLVGEEGPYTTRYTASRGHRIPAEPIGTASWIRHGRQRIAVVLVGYRSATYVRSDDAEDMGHFGVESGWYGTAYHRDATREEYEALQARTPRADGMCVSIQDAAAEGAAP